MFALTYVTFLCVWLLSLSLEHFVHVILEGREVHVRIQIFSNNISEISSVLWRIITADAP